MTDTLERLREMIHVVMNRLGHFEKVITVDEVNNRVGIGQTSPNAQLELRSDSAVDAIRISRGPGTTNFIKLYNPQGSPNAVTFIANNSVTCFSLLTVASGALGVGDVVFGNSSPGSPNMVYDVSGSSLLIQSTGANAVSVASAILELNSTTKGFLPPRMTTTQRTGISSPAEGLIVYDTDFHKLFVYTTAWEQVTSV